MFQGPITPESAKYLSDVMVVLELRELCNCSSDLGVDVGESTRSGISLNYLVGRSKMLHAGSRSFIRTPPATSLQYCCNLSARV